MLYLIIALVLAVGAAAFLGWRLYRTAQALRRAEAACREMERDRDIRQNLQHLLDSRIAENRRLKSRLRRTEDALRDVEQQANDLNLNLFHESGLRILKEKEEGARRMKLDLLERQLDDSNRKLRKQAEEYRKSEEMLQQIIADKQDEIDKLTAAQARRGSRRRAAGLPNQVTLSDLLGGEEEENI